MSTVAIYELLRNITTYRWLCEEHKKHEERLGWEVRGKVPAPELYCEECEFEARKERPV